MKKVLVTIVLVVSLFFMTAPNVYAREIVGTGVDDHYMRASNPVVLVSNVEVKTFLIFSWVTYDIYDAPAYDIYEINGETYSAEAFLYTLWECEYCDESVIVSGNPGLYYYNHVYFYVYGSEVERVWSIEGVYAYELKPGVSLKFTEENDLPGMRFRNPYSTIY